MKKNVSSLEKRIDNLKHIYKNMINILNIQEYILNVEKCYEPQSHE